MKEIVLASNNKGKIKEIAPLLEDYQIRVIPQAHFSLPKIEETGLTFIENALLKARHASKFTDLPSIADDSGLIVNVLNGAPGLYSSRYAGDKATDEENIIQLLSDMKQYDNRKAYFYCVIVYIRHFKDPVPLLCEGYWSGSLLTEPKGTQGFGYDPIFYVNEYQCSAGQLPLTIKNKISHRARALQVLHEKLNMLVLE